MTVDIKIGGTNIAAGDFQVWAHDATVTEDASPTSLSDSFGGVGSINAGTQTREDTLLSQGSELEVTFTPGGTRKGIITQASDTNGNAALTADTVMATLNRIINAPVVKTTLGDALRQYFGLAGLSITQYSIDPDADTRAALLPGWSGNCWSKMKELTAVEAIDFNEVNGVVQVTPRDADRAILLDTQDSKGLALTESIMGKRVETHFYDYRQITNELVYPPAQFDSTYGYSSTPGFRRDYETLSVTPGSPLVVDVPVMASLTSVQQPVCVKDPLPPDYVGPSAYNITTSNAGGGFQPVDPEEWYIRGGSVTVQILPDTTTLRITVDAGDNIFAAAPFHLGVSDGSGMFSCLRINGTGIAFTKTRLRQPTSIPDNLTDQDIATSTDSMFCRTLDQARAMLLAQAGEASRSITSLNAGIRFTDIALGQRAGAIVKRPEAFYRVRTASTTAAGISLTAVGATRLRDLTDAFTGKTYADLTAIWEGYTMRNFTTAPLRQATPPAPARPVRTGYGFGGYGVGPYGG